MTIGKLFAAAAAGAALAWCGAASAGSYDFTYSAAGPTPMTASGVLTTVAGGGDSQIITGISGLFNGDAITLLAPGSCCGGPNDNLLFPNDDAPPSEYLDLNGFAFSAGGQSFNIFFDEAFNYSVATPGSDFASFDGTFTLSPSVPEPMTWALMLLGIGALGAALRRRTAAAALA